MKTIASLVVSALLSPLAFASLEPLSDSELGDQTGQAFIQIDRSTNSQNLDFTKFTFGMDIDLSANADLIDMGRYERSDDPENYQFGSSDIRINDFALGSVNDDGTLNPFHITDPFFELAFDGNDLIGVRLGFGSALGKLSGNIEYLTGNLEVEVKGPAKPIRDNASGGVRFLLGLAGISDTTIMQSVSPAVLLNPNNGNKDPIRATGVGLANGNSLECVSGCGLLSGLTPYLTAGNCAILGIATCFQLKSFRTLNIGQDGAPATGAFLSFQSEAVNWVDAGKETPTVSGAFMNIPNGGISVNFDNSFNGIERIRTKFLDPYYD